VHCLVQWQKSSPMVPPFVLSRYYVYRQPTPIGKPWSELLENTRINPFRLLRFNWDFLNVWVEYGHRVHKCHGGCAIECWPVAIALLATAPEPPEPLFLHLAESGMHCTFSMSWAIHYFPLLHEQTQGIEGSENILEFCSINLPTAAPSRRRSIWHESSFDP